jgi:hypothetical protein
MLKAYFLFFVIVTSNRSYRYLVYFKNKDTNFVAM